MKFGEELKKSFFIALGLILLTFPIMVIQVNTIENVVVWRWRNLIFIGLGGFIFSFFCLLFQKKKSESSPQTPAGHSRLHRIIDEPRLYRPALSIIVFLALIFPFVFSHYQVNIMTTALIYVMLGLGLNIEVGLAGLLDLGYVAFYAVGAYSYALLNYHFGLGFWTALPAGAILAAFAGILVGFPVLRLRGDYLAIVTLAFAEIIRLVLENWNAFSFGPSGISNIPRPGFFGIKLTPEQSAIYMYFLLILMCIFTIFVIHRLQHSRIGRAWVALREDELACQAMGIDKTKAKLAAFALGATWAGMAGVLFAAKTTFINPASFTFLESAMILSIVVLGGMGSVVGVVIAALALILIPEYLRVFSNYRMLLFGAALIIMMVFRPQGILADRRKNMNFTNWNPAKKIERDFMENVLEVKNLTMNFGGIKALDRVCLEIKKNQIVALIGPNGAGKTTLFNCLTGIYTPSEGDIIVHTAQGKSRRINGMKINSITKLGLARTFQNIRLFGGMTVLENVMIGRHGRTHSGITGAIFRPKSTRNEEKAIVNDSYRILEYIGLTAYVNELARNLPYGAQRRLEIARALACDPQILLLDEPAAGMNSQETRELEQLIIRLWEERHLSILLIEHDMKLVMNLAQNIFVLDYGEEIARGTPEEITSNPVVIEAYLGVQNDAQAN